MEVTNLEQSKKLCELGFGIDSADMYYLIKRSDCRIPWEEAAKDDANVILFPKEMMSGNLSDYRLPCWSLGALLSLVPKNHRFKTVFREFEKDKIVWCFWCHAISEDVFEGNTDIECMYKAIVWMVENDFIKIGGQL